ncbi:Uncharacterised protein [Mycobacteroides abscessus]|nr:Uncharacterised protein [Mycobacteroides abscessus]
MSGRTGAPPSSPSLSVRNASRTIAAFDGHHR